MKYLLPLLFLTLLTTKAWSQKAFLPGYVVNTKNDTIRGLILYEDWQISPSAITFKADRNAKGETFTPADLTSFYIEPVNEWYDSRKVSLLYLTETSYQTDPDQSAANLTQEHFFIQKILASTQITLYKVISARDKRTRFFVEKLGKLSELINYSYQLEKNEKTYEVKVDDYKSQLRNLCNDASDFNSIAPPDYSERGLIAYLKRYNACFSAETSIYEVARQKPQIDIGLNIGSTPEVLIEGVRKQGQSSGLFGASVRLSLPHASYNRFVRLSFNVAPKVAYQLTTFIDSTHIFYSSGKTPLSNVELGMGSYLGSGSIRPYIYLAFNYLISTKLTGEGDAGFIFNAGLSYKRQVEIEVANLLSLSGQGIWTPRFILRFYPKFRSRN